MIVKKPKFLSVKSVPKLFWSSPKALTISPPPISVLFLVIGLVLFGLGEALLVASALALVLGLYSRKGLVKSQVGVLDIQHSLLV